MQRLNIGVYIFINVTWAISIILSLILSLDLILDSKGLFNFLLMLVIAVFQIVGAYKIWNKSYDIPILATFLFLFQIDIGGFKFIPQTLTNLYVKFEPYKLIIDGLLIDDPTILINLSFSDFHFQSIAINIVILIQLALLISYDNKISNIEDDR